MSVTLELKLKQKRKTIANCKSNITQLKYWQIFDMQQYLCPWHWQYRRLLG